MCVDANAGARFAAKQRHLDKTYKFKSQSIQYWNRETELKRDKNRIARGYSIGISNDYARALEKQGAAFKSAETAYKKYISSKGRARSFQGGRTKASQRGQLLQLLAAKGNLENRIKKEFGRNMDARYRKRLMQMQTQQVAARQKLGNRPEFGAPVLMPPTDYLSTFINAGISLASAYVGGVSGSDIKLKQNIEQVGISDQGYKVYEFNYIDSPVRYRGAMAQDVVKKNPMAVGIHPEGYLTVDYSKIDVKMEVV